MKICIDKSLPTHKLKIQASKFALKENEVNIPDGSFSHPLSLALETGKKWAPGRDITCYFMGGTTTQRTKVEREARKWESFGNFRFKFVGNNNADVRIGFNPDGSSWSYIGTDSKFVPLNESTMNFGWLSDNTPDAEYQRVVLHEFGHALGAMHEHQSPAGNIPWNTEAVYAYYTGAPNFWSREDVDVNLFAKYDANLSQFSEFDTKSIMLYAIPKELTLGGYEVGWNTDLSETDKSFMASCYPGSNIIVPPQPENLELIPGGAPIQSTSPANTPKNLRLNIGFSKGGIYRFFLYPKSLWVAVWSAGKVLKYNKGGLQVRLSPGQYTVRVRHSTGSGVFNVACKKV